MIKSTTTITTVPEHDEVFLGREEWRPTHGYNASMASLLNFIQTNEFSAPKQPARHSQSYRGRGRTVLNPSTTMGGVGARGGGGLRRHSSGGSIGGNNNGGGGVVGYLPPTNAARQQPRARPSSTCYNSHPPRKRLDNIGLPRVTDRPDVQMLRLQLDHRSSQYYYNSAMPTSMSTSMPGPGPGASSNSGGSNLMAAQELHAAIERRDSNAVFTMLHSGIDPNLTRGGVPAPPPTTSSSDRSTGLIGSGTNSGTAAAAAITGGVTPLHRAIAVGSVEMATFLALSGADLEAPSAGSSGSIGESALIRGVRCEFPDDFAALLCELGARVDAVDRSGRTALHYAAGLVAADDNTVLVLAAHGADVDRRDGEGRAPLHAAVAAGRTSAVVQLVRHGADVDAVLPGGATPLHLAVLRRNGVITRVLCEHGAAVDGVRGRAGGGGGRRRSVCGGGGGGGGGNSNGNNAGNNAGNITPTPLICAIEAGCTEIVRILIEHGADVNRRSTSNGGDSSSSPRSFSSSSTLVPAGTVSSRTTTTTTASAGAAAAAAGRPRDEFPLLAAARLGNLEVVDLLLSLKADLNGADSTGQTPLHAAAAGNQLKITRRLTEAGAVVSRRDSDGATPLLLAVRAGHNAVARHLLLEAGAMAETNVVAAVNDVDSSGGGGGGGGSVSGDDGDDAKLPTLVHQQQQQQQQQKQQKQQKPSSSPPTPLWHAVDRSHTEMARLLITAGGADPLRRVEVGEARDREDTPLHHAARRGLDDVVALALDRRRQVSSAAADVAELDAAAEETTNSLMASLLIAAAEGGSLSTVKMLLARGSVRDVVRARTADAAEDGLLAVATGNVDLLRFLLNLKAEPEQDAGTVEGKERDKDKDKPAAGSAAASTTSSGRSCGSSSSGTWSAMLSLVGIGTGRDKGTKEPKSPPHAAHRQWHRARKAGTAASGPGGAPPALDVNHRNRHGATALHHAALRGHAEAARLLLQRGAATRLVTVEIYETGEALRRREGYRQGTAAGLARGKGFCALSGVIERWKS